MMSKTEKFFLWFGVLAAMLGIGIPLFGLLPLEPPYDTWSALVFWAAVSLEVFCILMQFDIRGGWARFRGKDIGRGVVCVISLIVVALGTVASVGAEARNNNALIAEFRHVFLQVLPPQISVMEDACQAYKYYEERIETFQEVEKRNLWGESQLLITKGDARYALRSAGTNAVERLLSMRQLSPDIKKGKYCSDSLPDFGDEIEILQAVQEIINDLHLGYAEVHVKKSEIRTLALVAFKRQIVNDRRRQAKEGNDVLFYNACRALHVWKFPADQLFTPEERDRFSKKESDVKSACGS